MIAIQYELLSAPHPTVRVAGGGLSAPSAPALMLLLAVVVGSVVGGKYLARRWDVTFPGGLVREAIERLIAWPAGSVWVLRRRFNRVLTNQRMVYPSGKEEAFPRLELRLAPQDVLRLTPRGDLSAFCQDAAMTYTRHAERNGWMIPAGGVSVRIVADTKVRPGLVPPARALGGRAESRMAGSADGDTTDFNMFSGSGRFDDEADADPVLASTSNLANDDAVTAPAPAVMLTLDVLGLGVLVVREQTTVGRGRNCQVQLDSRYVSRDHANLYPTPDGWWVVDLGSVNKTLLQGRALSPHHPTRVSKGTTIQFGGRQGVHAVVVDSRTDPGMTTPYADTPGSSGPNDEGRR